MTQLEKNDLPVNHYARNQELLKMDNGNNNNASSSSATFTPPTSTAASPVNMNGEVEAAKSPDLLIDINGSEVGPIVEVLDDPIHHIDPHPVSKRARLSSLSPPTPIITSVMGAPIPLPAPTTLSIGGNAYGGNQSYLAISEPELPKYGSSERPSSPRTIYDFGNNGPSGSGVSNVSSKMPGVVGFGNLGNTCFMNSGLQSLLNTPPVVEFFLKSPTIKQVSPPRAQLTQSFQNLIRNAWHGPSSVIYPREFKDTLGNIIAQFKDCRQHDCQEFLAYTLDELHEQLKIWNNIKRGGVDTNDTNSSGFASGPRTESATSGSSVESLSTVNDSDVSSSLQSPGSNCEAETSMQQDGLSNTKKRRRLTDDSEVSASVQSGDKEEVKNSSSEVENSGPVSVQHSDVQQDDDAESEVDMLEEEDEDKRVLKHKAKQAEGFWLNYIRDNNTIIASSFQGMYKSTVTCSVCNYVSTTFEPFMYLSLPIPRTADRNLDVMFSGYNDFQINKVNVTMCVSDTVGRLKEEVVEKVFHDIQLSIPPLSNFVVAEVVNYHIITILKDDQPLKNVKDGIHNVYVLELNQNFSDPTIEVVGDVTVADDSFQPFPSQESMLRPTTYLTEDWENDSTNETTGPSVSTGGGFIPASDSDGTEDVNVDSENNSCKQENSEYEELMSCSVCLDDLPKSKLKQHYGCSCILCADCIKKTSACLSETDSAAVKAETKLKCPVCSEIVDYEKSFIPLLSSSDGQRKLNLIPVLFYYRPNIDSNNNNNAAPTPRFIGHPLVVQLPSTLTASEFYNFVGSIAPFSQNEYAIKNTSWNGKECGVCLYNRNCTGCEFRKDGIISINPRNSILISYSDLSLDLISSIEPPTMAKCVNPYSGWPSANCFKEQPLIDIYECLDTFSQTECLDNQNPWHCSVCQKNQLATKSITICRFPDYLIVYLKRFVFVDHSSNKLNNKLKFPIEGFDVSKYIAEEFAGGEHIYDLYSCVCHFGSASGGHYTSYSKNPKTDSWHYFNDDSVTNKSPSKDEFSSGYILFYAKKGLKSDIPLRRMMSPQQTCNMVTTGDIDSSTRTNSDECDTTFTAPDCSIDGETYTVPVGPENINSGLSNTNQEYIISSTSVDDHSIPTFAHNTSSEYFIASSSTSSSSTKVNCQPPPLPH
ncbi:uncharacterized protein LOC110842935 isoform X2 [Folsomia candida]|uniref:uncharacterized protein LOC110842935 isoform X2 n=1 Tax=Folsomia candida TaxID=158441 RepID=UPI000B8F9524|nr:uncharacterized protein LOC110842935 isoform X2 [Folsomia candida]